jgi:hypothetical protein
MLLVPVGLPLCMIASLSSWAGQSMKYQPLASSCLRVQRRSTIMLSGTGPGGWGAVVRKPFRVVTGTGGRSIVPNAPQSSSGELAADAAEVLPTPSHERIECLPIWSSLHAARHAQSDTMPTAESHAATAQWPRAFNLTSEI